MSRSKRKRAWRLSQIAKTGQAIGGGCWIMYMPASPEWRDGKVKAFASRPAPFGGAT